MGSKYTGVYANPKGPGDQRPTALQVIEDENLKDKLKDKVILITGCSSGIGIETARALSVTGATLYLTARDSNKAQSMLGDLTKKPNVHLLTLDLNSLDSVRTCAAEFLSKSNQLHILINNAGVMATPEGRTADGIETQFGVNHLAHFTLFNLLKDTLLASSTPCFNSRVIMVSSMAHRFSEVVLDNTNLDGIYDPMKAYGQSKTANIWTSNEIDRRYGPQGLHAFSLHPGAVMTGLGQFLSDAQIREWSKNEALAPTWKSVEQGAATTVWAAVAKELEGKGGKYLADCQIAGPHDPETGLEDTGYAPWAYDEAKEARLWEISTRLAGLDA